MKTISNYTAILIMALVFSSCVEVLEWDEAVEPSNTLVVEGLITTEEGPHTVYLRRTQDVINEGSGPGVMGALVSINDGSDTFHLQETEAGVYRTEPSVKGEVGKTYQLNIQLDGQSYSATAELIPAKPLDTLEIRPWAGNPYSSNNFQYFEMTYRSNFGIPDPYKYSVEFRLPDNVHDYYPADWDPPSWIERVLSTEDNIIRDSVYYLHTGLEPPALFAYGETIYAGFTYGTIVTEKFYSMTPEHYDFIRSVMSESDWKGVGLFGFLPANVPTNISNGAYGWFAASDVAVIEQVVE